MSKLPQWLYDLLETKPNESIPSPSFEEPGSFEGFAKFFKGSLDTVIDALLVVDSGCPELPHSARDIVRALALNGIRASNDVDHFWRISAMARAVESFDAQQKIDREFNGDLD